MRQPLAAQERLSLAAAPPSAAAIVTATRSFSGGLQFNLRAHLGHGASVPPRASDWVALATRLSLESSASWGRCAAALAFFATADSR